MNSDEKSAVSSASAVTAPAQDAHVSPKLPRGSSDLTSGPIWSRLLTFALPILLCNLFQQLYNTVDTAIVGIYVSSDAVGAVGSTGSLISLIVGFFIGLSSGAGVVVSRYFGARDDERVSRSVHTSMALSLICGALLTVLGIVLSRPLLVLMKTPDRIIELSYQYLVVYFSGMIPLMIYNMGAGVLRAVGDSRHPLEYLIASGIANIFLDYLFVAVIPWSVFGAAFATVISEAAAAVLTMAQLMRSKENYRFEIKKLRIDGHILSSIIRIGVPTGFQSMLYAISNILVQTNINIFGADAMAGCAAYGKIDGFLYMPINAFGLAVTTFTGQNMGAKKYDRVRRGARTGIIMASVCSAAGGAIVWFVARPLIGIFTQQNAEAVRYGMMMMHILATTYVVFTPTELLSGVIRGAGTSTQPTVITAVCICVLRVLILTVLMPLVGDIRLVYAVYPISWAVCSIVFIIYYRCGNWMKREI